MASGLLICLIAGLASFAATALVRRNAQRLGLVQAPNARSSHSIPTPSGGGVGIVLGGVIATLYSATQAVSPTPELVTLGTSLAIAAIGFWDDRRPLQASFRLAAQLILSLIAIVGTVAVEPLAAAAGVPAPLLVAGLVLAGVYWINLFNFMDGIDGIAASQAVFMLAGAAALSLAADTGLIGEPRLWWLLGVAAATLGFLMLNWPPAKIFMGDAGSTYLGLVIAILALLTVAWGWLSAWQWLILGAAFVTDASVTLARRLLNREPVFEAHRRHAYQALSRRWRSHRLVTLLFVAINVIWLLPLAVWAGPGGAGWLAVPVAYAPLVVLALLAGAGAPETSA